MFRALTVGKYLQITSFTVGLLVLPAVSLAATAPLLGTAASFAALAGSTVTNTGPSIIVGDLGVAPGTAVVGFPPGTVVGGTIHAADAVALQAQSDLTTAYNDAAGQACDVNLTGQDLGGMTLVPGVYCFSTSAQLTGALTLNAQGNPNAVFIFQIGTTLTTASASSVSVINGGSDCNVFWQIGSSATLGTDTSFVGNIMALASITATTGADIIGRALARTAATTLDTNVISFASCSPPQTEPLPPTLGKAFSPATIDAGDTSTLTITLSNPDDSIATLTAPLTDTLPSGVLVSGVASNTCGGTVSAPIGGSTVTLTGGAIPANGSCTVTVNVTAASGGGYINSIAIGALQTSNGSNAAPAVSTLTVVPAFIPPTLSKSFSPVVINAGGVSTLTITLSNANSTAAALTAPFVDTLPSGVLVASGGATTCGGAVSAPVGGSMVTLTGGSIPANGSCTVTVNVTAANGGNFINSIAAGDLKTNKGNNVAPAVATLTVLVPNVPPSLAKAFSPATINAGGTSVLTITLLNTNSGAAALTAPLVDTLPSGVTVASGGTNTCGGVVSAPVGGLTVTLTGGSIPANGSCTVTVTVTATIGGNFINSLAVGVLQTSQGNNTAPAIATLTVVSVNVAPTLGKAFSPATINAGGISLLTITLSNSNSTAAALTAPLVDTLPSGVVVSGGAANTCGGTVSAPVGGATVTLTGGSIPANGSCTVTVNVTAANGGNFINTLPAGALQTNKGNNAAPAIATLTVLPFILSAYECDYFLHSKDGDLSCSASGFLCLDQAGDTCGGNTLHVRCDNGFDLDDLTASSSLVSKKLTISGADHGDSGTVTVPEFLGSPGEYWSSLRVKGGNGFWASIYGSCQFK